MNERIIIGKNGAPKGSTPSVALINPKYPRNVATTIRAASCFGIQQVWYTGNRVVLESGQRLPREERMKGYMDVELIQYDYFFDQFSDCTPVAVELCPNAEILTTFEHPNNPLYVFGPEDGSIPQVIKRHCHRFVIIPTLHCTNLAAAVYLILYDRLMKRQLSGLEPIIPASQVLKNEDRGWIKFEDNVGVDYSNSNSTKSLHEMLV